MILKCWIHIFVTWTVTRSGFNSHIITQAINHARYFSGLRHLDTCQLYFNVAIIFSFIGSRFKPEKFLFMIVNQTRSCLSLLPALRACLKAAWESNFKLGLERHMYMASIGNDLCLEGAFGRHQWRKLDHFGLPCMLIALSFVFKGESGAKSLLKQLACKVHFWYTN